MIPPMKEGFMDPISGDFVFFSFVSLKFATQLTLWFLQIVIFVFPHVIFVLPHLFPVP